MAPTLIISHCYCITADFQANHVFSYIANESHPDHVSLFLHNSCIILVIPNTALQAFIRMQWTYDSFSASMYNDVIETHCIVRISLGKSITSEVEIQHACMFSSLSVSVMQAGV